MMYFVSYDIADPKRLVKISKILENYGIRIQYSFFQCEMEKSQLDDLAEKLLTVIDCKKDSLRIYPLCEGCTKKTISCGNGNIFIHRNYQIL